MLILFFQNSAHIFEITHTTYSVPVWGTIPPYWLGNGLFQTKPTYPYRGCCMEFQTFFNVSQPEKFRFPPSLFFLQHPLLELWQILFLFTETRQFSNYKKVCGGVCVGGWWWVTHISHQVPLFGPPILKSCHLKTSICYFSLLFCFFNLSCQKVSFP